MSTPFGQSLRRWRRTRGLSQLELSLRAQTSARHLSFLETGRSRPGEDMVCRLAESLDLPLRDRNDLLRTAGFSAIWPEHALGEAPMAPYRRIVRHMLEQHEPFPAFVVDRWWRVVDANAGAAAFLGQLGAHGAHFDFIDALDGPLRAQLDNWDEVAWHGLYRLRRETSAAGGDERLERMLGRMEELLADVPVPPVDPASPLVCPRVTIGGQTLRFVGTIARFGSAVDVTLSELRVELMFPADDATATCMRALAQA